MKPPDPKHSQYPSLSWLFLCLLMQTFHWTSPSRDLMSSRESVNSTLVSAIFAKPSKPTSQSPHSLTEESSHAAQFTQTPVSEAEGSNQPGVHTAQLGSQVERASRYVSKEPLTAHTVDDMQLGTFIEASTDSYLSGDVQTERVSQSLTSLTLQQQQERTGHSLFTGNFDTSSTPDTVRDMHTASPRYADQVTPSLTGNFDTSNSPGTMREMYTASPRYVDLVTPTLTGNFDTSSTADTMGEMYTASPRYAELVTPTLTGNFDASNTPDTVREMHTAPPQLVTPTPSYYVTPLQKLCPRSLHYSNLPEGEIAWFNIFGGCVPSYVTWIVELPEDFGFVVQFHQVQMYKENYIEIYSHRDRTERERQRMFSTSESVTSMGPLILHARSIEIVATVLDSFSLTHFVISYKAYPISLLPRPNLSENNRPRESEVTYHCSGMTVPDEILCDGIRHCVRGEDEMNCSYSQHGCGDWVPYNGQCLKALFSRALSYIPGHTEVTMPFQAEQHCQSKHGATLALLPDSAGVEIVTDMIHASGYSNAVVGLRKVKPVTRRLSHLHRYLWQWGQRGSPIAYEQQQLQRQGTAVDCAMLTITPQPSMQPVKCFLPMPSPDGFVCMRPNPTLSSPPHITLDGVRFARPSVSIDRVPTKECGDGSVAQLFHRCQWGTKGGQEDTSTAWSPSGLPLFQCRFGPPVHFSLLCDGNSDCADRSDELYCQRPRLRPLRMSSFICRSMQAIPSDQRCDGMADCYDESDEEYCMSCASGAIPCPSLGCVWHSFAEYFDQCPILAVHGRHPLYPHDPAAVTLDGYGMSRLEPAIGGCVEGQFQCFSGLCIPTFLINNGEQDCQQGEDEDIPVQNMTCPGYYRCQDVGTCVHPSHVCDGIYHCPNKDDELFCSLACPRDRGCTCEGQAYTCSRMIDPLQNLHLRYLDLSYASDVRLDDIRFMEYLFFLNLSSCQLGNVTLTDMPQLQTLDLSFNSLRDLASLNLFRLSGLLYLNLSNNPFVKTLDIAFRTLLLRGTLRTLKTLVMVNVSLEGIEGKVLRSLSQLQHLDIRDNPLHSYSQGSLSGLLALSDLYTDNSKLCCSYFHASLPRCHAPVDELSSCSDLLAQDFFRVCLWTLAVLAILGNGGVLVYRLLVSKHASPSAFRIMVQNLCASDLLMGVYMAMIGVADARFQGRYVAREAEWTHSAACTAAGFLSFVSSEVSAFLVCLITVDRVLALCFPLNSGLRFTARRTVAACGLIWTLGVSLAVVPILSGMDFYGQNGICVPLPITRQQFSGQSYAFAVFIVLNFVLFLLVGAGQLLIYRAVQGARAAAGSERRQQDTTIARRLFLVVITDFCCWFPIGVLGLMAKSGTPVPGQVNVWAAIFVLPLNSALNPFLYTLNGLRQQWKTRREDRRARRLLGKLKTEIPKWPAGRVQEVVRVCLHSKRVDKEALSRSLGLSHSLSGPLLDHTDHTDLHDPQLDHTDHTDLHDPQLDHTDHTDLHDPQLDHTDHTDIHLDHTDLPDHHLDHTDLPDPHLDHTDLPDSQLDHTALPDPQLDHTDLPDPHLDHTDLPDSQLDHTDLPDPHLDHTDLSDSQLDHTALPDPLLDHTDLLE